jgi:thiamine biosynthesis lipoprotein
MSPQLELDRRTLRLIALAFVLLAALTVHRLFVAGAPDPTDVLLVRGETMGTRYSIRVAGDGLDDDLHNRIEAETEHRLDQVDRWMSNWNPDSEIGRFNARTDRAPFPVSRPTADLIAFAIRLNETTNGAFDVTVGPLVARWGFGSGARVDGPPTQEEIDAALRHIGPGKLRVGTDPATGSPFLAKSDPETRVDLSAIAKGFGVDHVAEGLTALGREDFLVEIGGEVRASGERPGGGPWRVAVEKPLDDGRAIQSVVEITDRAMATSGDYRIFYETEGRRVSHTIDPRTGRPVENGPASASVLAGSAMVADAWATALMVLGEDGLALANHEGLAALLLLRDADGTFVERPSEAWPGSADGP